MRRDYRVVFGAALVGLALSQNAAAEISAWKVKWYKFAGPYGSTTSQFGDKPDLWGPTGWPGVAWAAWDCESVTSPEQFAYVATGTGPYGGGTLARLIFEVVAPTTYAVSLSATSSNQFTQVSAMLLDASNNSLLSRVASPGSPTQSSLTQMLLQPGQYELCINSTSSGSVSGSAQVRIDVVPAPGAIALLGAAGLVGTRRRR